MALGQPLQGGQRRGHLQEGGVGIVVGIVVGHVFYDECPDASAVELANVSVAVAHLCAEGEEECLFGETERAAVGEQPPDADVCSSVAACAYERRHFLSCI